MFNLFRPERISLVNHISLQPCPPRASLAHNEHFCTCNSPAGAASLVSSSVDDLTKETYAIRLCHNDIMPMICNDDPPVQCRRTWQHLCSSRRSIAFSRRAPPRPIRHEVEPRPTPPRARPLDPARAQPRLQILALADVQRLQRSTPLDDAVDALASHSYTSADAEVLQVEEVQANATQTRV